MSFLVRKINKAKWPKEGFSSFEVSRLRADAITSDLRTHKDTLSTWEIPSLENLSEAILALVSTFERLDTIDVVIIDRTDIVNGGFEILDTSGDTPIEYLKDIHKDIAGLTYQTIGDFSKLLLDTMGMDGRTKRYTVTKVKALINEAIKDGTLELDSLKEGLRNNLVNPKPPNWPSSVKVSNITYAVAPQIVTLVQERFPKASVACIPE